MASRCWRRTSLPAFAASCRASSSPPRSWTRPTICRRRNKTVRFRLKRRFPHLPEALAGPGGNVPVIMPERLAAESPYKAVAEVVGSGPYRFLKDEHVSGARAVFERFAEYQPRAAGPVGFTAGPKVAHFERVEWLTLDPFSASAAL